MNKAKSEIIVDGEHYRVTMWEHEGLGCGAWYTVGVDSRLGAVWERVGYGIWNGDQIVDFTSDSLATAMMNAFDLMCEDLAWELDDPDFDEDDYTDDEAADGAGADMAESMKGGPNG